MARHRRHGNRSPRRLRDPSHESLRTVLRIVGPVMLVAGVILFVVGVYDFMQAFGDSHPAPTKFWMCFLGVPLMGIGFVISKFGFLGAAVRYVAGETAPVASDALNYVARSTKDSVREVAGAVAEGLRGERAEAAGAACAQCGQKNDVDANFCDHCGATLVRSALCPDCGRENDADANFCDGCGGALGGG